MTSILEINTDILRAAMCAVSYDKHRDYLHGVYFDPRGWIAATNGHVLFAAQAPDVAARMTNEEIGKEIGLPKSTVQAMGTGRVAERFTPAQRERFHALLNFQQAQIEAARRALG